MESVKTKWDIELDVEFDGNYTPGCGERGPSYDCGGTPAEPPEFEVTKMTAELPDGETVELNMDKVPFNIIQLTEKAAFDGADEESLGSGVNLYNCGTAEVEVMADDKAHFLLWGSKFPIYVLGISRDPDEVWEELAVPVSGKENKKCPGFNNEDFKFVCQNTLRLLREKGHKKPLACKGCKNVLKK